MSLKVHSILHLPIKKKWFDMIRSGEKTEEYRTVKSYWHSRLVGKKYDFVEFRNGYGLKSPRFLTELKEITIGIGKPEWGAKDKLVYVIKLGKIVEIDLDDETTTDEQTVIEDPTWYQEIEEVVGPATGADTDNVSVNTQLICPNCGGKNYLRNKKCVKCDYGWV